MTTNEDQAALIRDRFNADLQTIRANQTLAEAAKTSVIAHKYLTAKDAIDALKDADSEQASKRVAELRTKVFALKAGSSASDIISVRDAQDRVDRIESEDDAAKVMGNAIAAGDRVLATATLRKAFEYEWVPVVSAHQEAFPATADDINELWSADHTPILSLMLSGGAWTLPKPREINRGGHLTSLAAQGAQVLQSVGTLA